jgi:cytochrome c-type biogenesis protein CcmH/NrfF
MLILAFWMAVRIVRRRSRGIDLPQSSEDAARARELLKD